MSRLTEKFIQKKALEYLKEKYIIKYNLEKIYSKDEVRTNAEYSNKRADGLICFNSTKQKAHTISVEAKSHKTLGSLLTYWNNHKLLLHALIISIPLALLSIFFTYTLAWYWISLITLASMIFLFVLVGMIAGMFEFNQYKLINVISQVNQYPANEKWIAISQDSINLAKKKINSEFYKKTDYENFLQMCKNQKIGVLVVTRRNINEVIKPKYISGDYIDCYSTNNKIKTFIKEN